MDRKFDGPKKVREWDLGECVGMCYDAFCRCFVFSHGAPPCFACSATHDGMCTVLPGFFTD
jgi:hypothetical protein